MEVRAQRDESRASPATSRTGKRRCIFDSSAAAVADVFFSIFDVCSSARKGCFSLSESLRGGLRPPNSQAFFLREESARGKPENKQYGRRGTTPFPVSSPVLFTSSLVAYSISRRVSPRRAPTAPNPRFSSSSAAILHTFA